MNEDSCIVCKKTAYPRPEPYFCDSCQRTFMLCNLCKLTYTDGKPHHQRGDCPECNEKRVKRELGVPHNFR